MKEVRTWLVLEVLLSKLMVSIVCSTSEVLHDLIVISVLFMVILIRQS